MYEDEVERLVHSGKYAEAEAKIKEVLAVAPDNAYLHFLYGDLLWDMNDEEAESAADIAGVQEQADIILGLVQSPGSEKEFVARSWASLAKGDLNSALADTNEALRLSPNSGPAAMLRGTIRYEQAVLHNNESLQSAADEIMADYDSAVDRMRDYAQVYVNRAHIRAALGDFDLAITDIKQAIGLRPRASYYYALGSVYYRAGRLEEAHNSYMKAVALNPQHYKSHCGLADIRFKKGDWKGALASYLMSNKLHPTVYAFGQLGWTFRNLKQYEEAKKNFDTALRYNRYDFASHYGLASAHFALKDFKSALGSYDNALAYAPKNDPELLAALHRERAEVYRQSGQEGTVDGNENK
jgi:tetratricopeptide (TPR) repeat protein